MSDILSRYGMVSFCLYSSWIRQHGNPWAPWGLTSNGPFRRLWWRRS